MAKSMAQSANQKQDCIQLEWYGNLLVLFILVRVMYLGIRLMMTDL